MESKKIQILLIEDSVDDIELIKRKLEKSANTRFQVTATQTLHDGLKHIDKNTPDLILSDLGLPDSNGLDTVTKILLQSPHIPLVVLSGFDDEAIAIKAVQLGAQDYLVKGQMEGVQIERSLFYSIERARLQRELEQNAQEISKIHSNLLKILDNNADAIVVVSQDGHILFTNPAIEPLLGCKQKELLNTHFNFPLDEGKTSEIEIKHANQETTVAEMNTVGISWGGKPATLVSLHDITKRKLMENALRESEEKFSVAFRSSPDMMAIANPEDGKYIEINDAFCRTTGYSREELIGHPVSEIQMFVYPEESEEMLRILQEQGEMTNEEFTFRIKSGEIRQWLCSAKRINIGGAPCTLSIAIDITERKQMEEALRFSDAAFRSLHESVIATDTQYVITHWNKISEQMYGIKESQAIGKKIQDVIEVMENLPGENEMRLKRLEADGYYREEQLHYTKHGEVWVDVSVQAIEENGKRYGWVMLASAITQRKMAEEALKRSEEKYRELINTSTDGIVSADQQMRITIWNHGAEKIFGYTEREMLGQSVLKIVPNIIRKEMTAGFNHFTKTGFSQIANQIMEAVGIKKDGTEVPIELSMSTRKAGDTYVATAIIRDISVRKEAEEKLRKIDKMKTEFLSNVSHELRTPLQSISGFTKLIMNGQVPDPATQQEFLQIIDRETMHLGNLINSLLDMSRLESNRFQIYKKPVPMRDTIIDSVKMFHSLARDKNINLHEEIPEQLPEMEVDSERLRQVIINLLSNAIKFSNPGTSINVKAEKKEKELLFQVADHGIGITEKSMAHLFERFYRAEGDVVRGGTGLGLYISKQIIEAHGGRIWAESKFGEGSTFSFTLPLNGKGGNSNGKENSRH